MNFKPFFIQLVHLKKKKLQVIHIVIYFSIMTFDSDNLYFFYCVLVLEVQPQVDKLQLKTLIVIPLYI